MFYDQPETIDHLFFQYTITKCVWAMIGQCMGLITHQENASSTSSVSIGGCQELNIHHFGFAAVCWAIWKCPNKACFENKIINSPIEIIIHICALLTYWSGLYNQKTQGKILEGVQALLACAHRVMIGQAPATHPTRLLPPPEDLDEDDSEE